MEAEALQISTKESLIRIAARVIAWRLWQCERLQVGANAIKINVREVRTPPSLKAIEFLTYMCSARIIKSIIQKSIYCLCLI
jgi:hypothetical protein